MASSSAPKNPRAGWRNEPPEAWDKARPSAPIAPLTEAEICEAERWFETNLRAGIARHSAKHGLRLVEEIRRLRQDNADAYRRLGIAAAQNEEQA